MPRLSPSGQRVRDNCYRGLSPLNKIYTAGGLSLELGQHAARFSGGRPGVLQGTRSYLLQDEGGQVALTEAGFWYSQALTAAFVSCMPDSGGPDHEIAAKECGK